MKATEPLAPKRRLMRTGLARRGPLILLISASLGLALSTVMRALTLAEGIEQAFLEGANLNALSPYAVTIALWSTLHAVFAGIRRASAGTLAASVKSELRQRLVDKLGRLGPAHPAASASHAGLTLIEGVEALEAFFRDFLPGMLHAALVPLLLIIVLLTQDPLSGVTLLLTAPLIPLFMALIGVWAGRVTRTQWRALAELGAYFTDAVRGMRELRALNADGFAVQRIRALSEEHREATMRVLSVAFLSALMLELLATLSTAVVAVEVGLRLLQGGLTYAPALTVLVLAPEVFTPLRNLGSAFHPAQSAEDAATRIYALLDAPEPARPLVCASNTGEGLTFRKVSYAYPRAEVLKEVDLSVRPGELVVLKGKSGEGKSTLLWLALGFLSPHSGEVCLNGRPVAPERFTYLPQRPHLFPGTVRENLLLAAPEASEAALRWALRRSGFDEVVARLPQGLDTVIGEGGVGLSGGERQRLALARALLHDGEAVLFDEPSAHLDPESERRVLLALETLKRSKPVLVIAHRSATIAAADRVFELGEGRLREVARCA